MPKLINPGASSRERQIFRPMQARSVRGKKLLTAAGGGIPPIQDSILEESSVQINSSGSDETVIEMVETPCLLRRETGTLPSAYKTAYEQAYRNEEPLLKSTAADASWSKLIDILMQGKMLRERMNDGGSTAESDSNTATSFLRHFMDIKLALQGLSGRPSDTVDSVYIQKTVIELKQLQRSLLNRIKGAIDADRPLSLSFSLTYFSLGAVSIALKKLNKGVSIAFLEGAKGEATFIDNPLPLEREQKKAASLPQVKNALSQRGFTLPPRPQLRSLLSQRGPITESVRSLARGDLSVLEILFQAATEHLEQNKCPTPYATLFASLESQLLALGDEYDRGKGADPFKIFLQHTEELRESQSEPIKASLSGMAFLMSIGAGAGILFLYKFPEIVASGDYYQTVNSPTFFDPVLPPPAFALPPTNSSGNVTLGNSSLVMPPANISLGNASLTNSSLPLNQSTAPVPGDTPLTQPREIYNWAETFSLPQVSKISLGGSVYTEDGGIEVTGYTLQPFMLYMLKINATGFLDWAHTLSVDGKILAGYRLLRMPNNQTLMVGNYDNKETLLISYDVDGTPLCLQRVGGLSASVVEAAQTDNEGNILLSGIVTGLPTQVRFLIKLLSNSNQCQSIAFAKTLTGGNSPSYGIKVTHDGHILTLTSLNNNVLLTTYTSNGDLLGAQLLSFNGTMLTARALAIDSFGNTWVGGQTALGYPALIKIDPYNQIADAFTWQINGPTGSVSDLAIGPDGTPLVIGTFQNTGYLASFDENNTWGYAFSGEPGDKYLPQSVTIDPENNTTAMVAGYVSNLARGTYIPFAAQLSPPGSLPTGFNSSFLQLANISQITRISPNWLNVTATLNNSDWPVTVTNLTDYNITQVTPTVQDLFEPFTVTSGGTNRRSLEEVEEEYAYLADLTSHRAEASDITIPTPSSRSSDAPYKYRSLLISTRPETTAASMDFSALYLLGGLFALLLCCMHRRRSSMFGFFNRQQPERVTPSASHDQNIERPAP